MLQNGSYKELVSEHNLLAYGRFDRNDMLVVVINNSDDERRVSIPVWELGMPVDTDMEQIFVTYDGGYSTQRLYYSVNDGWISLGMRRHSSLVLRKA